MYLACCCRYWYIFILPGIHIYFPSDSGADNLFITPPGRKLSPAFYSGWDSRKPNSSKQSMHACMSLCVVLIVVHERKQKTQERMGRIWWSIWWATNVSFHSLLLSGKKMRALWRACLMHCCYLLYSRLVGAGWVDSFCLFIKFLRLYFSWNRDRVLGTSASPTNPNNLNLKP